jgi:tetratricopeptide (TPR) repeat protein
MSIEKYLKDAEEHMKTGVYFLAAENYMNAAEISKKYYKKAIRAYLKYSKESLKKRDYDMAALGYERIGRCFEEIGEYEMAARYFLKAGKVKLKARYDWDATNFQRAAKCFEKLGEIEKAARAYKKGAKAYFEKGIYYEAGDYYKNVAISYQKLGKKCEKYFGLALECFDRAIEKDPNYVNVYKKLEILIHLKRAEEGKELIKKILENKNDIPPHSP